MAGSYQKILSKNDTGETPGHQAGIAVPKRDQELLDFLPALDLATFNPDAWLSCIDPDGEKWKIRYIYYNGQTFDPPRSTRNEYRLTHTNSFMKKYDAKSGDILVMNATDSVGCYEFEIMKLTAGVKESSQTYGDKIILRGWNKVY